MIESALKRRLLKALNAVSHTKAITLVRCEAGTPDILCVHRGRVILVELKVGKGKLTHLQARRLEEWRAAGTTALVVREDSDAASIVEGVASAEKLPYDIRMATREEEV